MFKQVNRGLVWFVVTMTAFSKKAKNLGNLAKRGAFNPPPTSTPNGCYNKLWGYLANPARWRCPFAIKANNLVVDELFVIIINNLS